MKLGSLNYSAKNRFSLTDKRKSKANLHGYYLITLFTQNPLKCIQLMLSSANKHNWQALKRLEPRQRN